MSGESLVNETGYVEHVIEHCQQRFNWDCGLSCVLMMLPAAQRDHVLANYEQICQEEGFGHSTWTIDLCYLLKRFGIEHCMYTTLLGVNDDYRRHGYYEKIINTDRERVVRRFRDAAAAGVRAERRTAGTAELLAHLDRHGPLIALVDAGLLVCDLCDRNQLEARFRRCFGGSYSGHYVAVVGHGRGRLLYRDPARGARLCAAPGARLQRARAASGTDQDLVLVYNDYRRGPCRAPTAGSGTR